MKNLITFIFVLFLANSTKAQSFSDVVYLKDGSIIKCEVIENHPMDSIKIKTQGGLTFVYNYSQIEKITSSPSSDNSKTTSTSTTNKFIMAEKYRNITYNNMKIDLMQYSAIKKILKTPNDPKLNSMISAIGTQRTIGSILTFTGAIIAGAGAGISAFGVAFVGLGVETAALIPLIPVKGQIKQAMIRYNEVNN